ncbi:D-amino-acid dehydrogenase [Rhizomicrobium palustre]|uniref:D-amino-acid dehydrogenase n=1 Tax=Rhizomicrobium palustre TaxID=189966 RepID=A0A846N0K9_9PROT|nr:FAD-binding oxidoreductase [Rhizomicrobium palustre]NIK89484.1 D-amino-acid dehydrogenase [Rhizomicrobium palustre]
MTKAVVTGAGIIGSAVALKLRQSGLDVTLIDAPPSHGKCASWGNAGHIAVEQVAPIASMATVLGAPRRLLSPHGALSLPLNAIDAWLPFSIRLLKAAQPKSFERGSRALALLLAEAVPAWKRFTESLCAPELMRGDGHFIVWNSAKSAAAGRQHWMESDTGTASIRDASEEEMEALQALSAKKIEGAVRCIGSGQISDPAALFAKLESAFSAAGITRLNGKVRALQREDDTARILLDNEVITADVIVVAAGFGSRALLETAGHKVPMIAERGYHVQYEAQAWPQMMPPVVFEDYATIVTRFASSLRAASFVEFGKENLPADPAKWRRITRTVRDLGLKAGAETSQWVGSRPTLPDYLPAIGKSRAAANLFYAFGHNHLGLTLGPLTAERIASMVTGQSQSCPAFDIERF